MLKNYKLQQSAITLTVILSLTFNIIKTEEVKSCQNVQSVFDYPMAFEQKIIEETNNYTINGNDYLQSQTWQIQNNSDTKEMFSDQILTMQAFENQSDILQLQHGTCYFSKSSDDTQFNVKIVTRRLHFNLQQYLEDSEVKQNHTLIIDIIFRILLAVRKMHINGFLHLNLNLNSIQFTSNHQLVLTNMEFAMPKSRFRNFQFNRDFYVAPEIDQQVNQKENQKIKSKLIWKLYRSC